MKTPNTHRIGSWLSSVSIDTGRSFGYENQGRMIAPGCSNQGFCDHRITLRYWFAVIGIEFIGSYFTSSTSFGTHVLSLKALSGP
jgi:hypothetical protein